MSFQHGGGGAALRNLGLPHAGENDEFDPDQAKGAVRLRFVDQRFGFGRVESSGRDSRTQYKVHSHRAEIRAADAGRGLCEKGGERWIYFVLFCGWFFV